MVPSKGLALAPIQFQAEVLAFSGRELAPWNNCSTLRTFLGQNHLSDGNIQEAPGVRASESTRLVERTMGIEPTSHALQAIEYTGFPSLVRVQLRPTSGNLNRPPSPVL